MRIGLITGEYPPMHGGISDFTRQLARALVQIGHEIHVFTDQRAEGESTEQGITVTHKRGAWTQALLTEVRPWIEANHIEVINLEYEIAAFNMAAAVCWLPDLLTTPVVTTFHDTLPPYLFPLAGGYRKGTVHHLAQTSEGVIVTNRADERELRALNVPVSLIPIGSAIEDRPPPDYDRMKWRKALHIDSEMIVVGYFGFLNASKGVDTLIEAVSKLPNIHLLMIGGDTGANDPTNQESAAAIRAQAESLIPPHAITWTGFVNDEEASAHFHAADIIALPFKDGITFRRSSFMAAIAHGVSVITTQPQVYQPELEEGRNVLLVPPDDPVALAETIRKLSENRMLRVKLGIGARLLSTQFEWPIIASQTASVLSNAGLTRRFMRHN